MASGKKTFIFYSDWINMIRQMPDSDAGQLLKHVLSFVNDEHPETDNILVKMAFGHMKPMLKSDLDKWDTIRSKRKEAGSKGGQANAKQIVANAKQTEAVNDNVNVNVNGLNVNKKRVKEFTPPSLQEVTDYFKENGYTQDSAFKAFNYYSTADWKDSTGKGVKNWKQKMIAVWFKDENKEVKETTFDTNR